MSLICISLIVLIFLNIDKKKQKHKLQLIIGETADKHIRKMEMKEGEMYHEDYGECLPYGGEL